METDKESPSGHGNRDSRPREEKRSGQIRRSGPSKRYASGILFTLGKTAILAWENLGLFLLLNMAGSMAAAGFFFVPMIVNRECGRLAGFGVTFAFIVAFSLWSGIAGGIVSRFTAARRIPRSEVRGYGRKVISASLLTLALALTAYLACGVLIPFYLAQRTILSFCAALTITLFLLLLPPSALFIFPALWTLDVGTRDAIRIGIRIILEEIRFSSALSLLWWLLIAFSSLTAFIFPGFAGLLLFAMTGFRVLLLKRSYLEKYPNDEISGTPWERILEEEREKLGDRSLKRTFFPWRE